MTQHSRTAWHNTLHSIAVAALAVCISAPIHAQTQSAPANATPSLRPGEPVTLNFTNADIEAVSRAMAAITNRNVVVDPRVKGQITLLTDKAVSPATAYQQYLAALRMQGFTVVESTGLFKVIPEADAKLQTNDVAVGHGGRSGGGIVTQIFKLNYENAANLVPVLRPLISPNNTINVNPGNNSLVITDYADNLQRISRIIASTDVSNATDVEVIALRHAVASDMVALVTRLMEGGSMTAGGAATAASGAAAGQTDTSFRTSILAEPRSNSVLIRAANPAKLSQIRSLIARLDQPAMTGNGDDGNIHVVYLKNADAVSLAATLRAAISAQTSASSALGVQAGMNNSASAGGGNSATQQPTISRGTDGSATVGLGGGNTGPSSRFGTSQQPSTGGLIQADPTTNSLIITAPGPMYRQLRAVIDKLDGRRAQVLIEALIVEVSADKAAQLGVQWSTIIRNNGRVLGVLGNGTSVSGIPNIFGISGAVSNLVNGTPISGDNASAITGMKGMNLGFTQSVGGNTSLGALVNLMQGDSDTNILSTPNLMTLDNEEASIMVGENVPFPSTTSVASAVSNPFTTYERKDVGTLLRIRPQINENGTIKMAVYQETSNVKASTAANPATNGGATTTKRSIESNVLVEDGSILVLGGLIAEEYQQNQERVPLLGDIPVVGNLFRNTARTRKKTNLMVFLRPTVLRDAGSTSQFSQDRYEAIRGVQQNAQPDPNLLMRNVSDAPVLPALGGSATQADVLIVPGAKPELVDFTRPGQPTVDGRPVTVTPVAPAAPVQPGTL